MQRAFSRREGATYLLATTVACMTSACITTGTTVPEAALPKESPPVQLAILCRADQTDKNVESADCLQRVQGPCRAGGGRAAAQPGKWPSQGLHKQLEGLRGRPRHLRRLSSGRGSIRQCRLS
jgi:hypothetical protein